MNSSTLIDSSTPTVSPHDASGSVAVTDVVLKVIYAILGTLGIVGNFMVCFVFIKIKALRKTFTNIFILNQSLIDLTSAIMFVALKFGPSFDVIPSTIGGDVLCKIWVSEYVLWGLFISSTFNLSFLAIERYLAICHPVLHRNKITMTKVKIVVVCVWFVGFIRESYWPTMNFNEDGICNVEEWPNRSVQSFVGFIVFTTEYILPLGIMAFSYGNIILELRRRSKTNKHPAAETISTSNQARDTVHRDITQSSVQHPATRQNQVQAPSGGKTKPQDDSMGKARKNVTKTMLIVSVTFVISWSPMSISFFVYNLGGYLDYDSFYYYFMVLLVFSNMCINPFIYAIKYKEFREGIFTIFSCVFNRVDATNDLEMERA
ncbi:galanin receptor 2b-like [Glandiceps talaboti]